MITLKALINTIMIKAKILAAGEEAAPAEFQDVLADIRRMVDTWRLENLMIYVNARKQFDLQPGAASYAIGDGALWDQERPIDILSASIKDGAGGSFPLRKLASTEYSELSHKGSVGRPTSFYYHATYPIAAVLFNKVPDDPIVELVVQESLVLPTDLSAEMDFPPGYEDCLIYNGAVRICGDFGKSPSQELLGLAIASKALVKRANVQVPLLKIEHGVGLIPGTYDINAGPVV